MNFQTNPSRLISPKLILLGFFLFLVINAYPTFAQDQETGEIINVNHQYKIAFTDLNSDYLRVGDIVKVYKGAQFLTYLEVSEASSAITKLIPVEGKGGFDTKINFKAIAVGDIVVSLSSTGAPKKKVEKVTTPTIKGFKSDRVSKLMEDTGASTVTDTVSVNIEDKKSELDQISGRLTDELKKLSENYAILSSSLSKVKNEKEILEAEYTKVSDELDSARRKIEELEIQNLQYQQEIMELNAYKKTKIKTNRQREEDLKKTILNLKKRLEKMSELVEEN